MNNAGTALCSCEVYSLAVQADLQQEIATMGCDVILVHHFMDRHPMGRVPWDFTAEVLTFSSFLLRKNPGSSRHKTAFSPKTFLRTDFLTIVSLRHLLFRKWFLTEHARTVWILKPVRVSQKQMIFT